ncbi:glycosyltransferase family 25 protein [Hypoxylon sp. CI-4A]|nr:glycosyltransferase family 25 protein [Hypoxylon sp. CI-4A]
MPPYRRAFLAICIFTPLIYIYWQKFAFPVALNDFGSLQSSPEDVFNKTLGFSKIFAINLPSRTDRRDAMVLAGAVSNLTFTWINGISGDQVVDIDAPIRNGARLSGAKGSWRSHMNVLQTIIRDNLGSALIMEDDIDWDIRIKSQLQTFALASRTWLRQSKSYKPSVQRQARAADTGLEGHESNTVKLSPVTGADREAHKTVYGDDWDVLWLGHCGADFPSDESQVSPLRVVIPDDETVPAPKHLKPHPFALPDKLGEAYAPHTRVVHTSSGNICTLAYAVSRRGARKLLSEFENHYDTQWDLMLQKWCGGKYSAQNQPLSEQETSGSGSHDNRNAFPTCLTIQPPLFSHHYAKGGASDIQGQGGGYAKGSGTPYVRLSVRANLRRLVTGEPLSEIVDQLPDDGKTIWK